MTTSARKVRGRPFQSGNPGRPPGSKNKITQLVEQLAEGKAEQLIRKALELAEAGDVQCLRMILDRLWPIRKGQPVQLNVTPINNSKDVLSAITSILTAVCEGRLTPDEAGALFPVIDRSIEVIELKDVIRRIEDLEKARDTRNEKKHAPAA
jgi:hypothetical protein